MRPLELTPTVIATGRLAWRPEDPEQGVILYRGHTVLHFCRQQDTVALSSAEAELKASCKTLVEVLGLRTLAEFLTDRVCPVRHHVDASAAVGVLTRQGQGN